MSLGGFGVPKFGNFFGWFGGSEIRKLLWVLLGFRASETSLGDLRVPIFGNFFGWFGGSEIRKRLWVVLGFQNSETSLGMVWRFRNSKVGGRNASKNVFLIISELRSSQNLQVK